MTYSSSRQSSSDNKQLAPQWIEDMHEHYRQEGFYRSEDLQRVVGDPRECISVEASTDIQQLLRNMGL
jgi:hypothetical protein